jgi:flagellar motor protein MotB
MKKLIFLTIILLTNNAIAQKNTPNNGDWTKHEEVLFNTPEAEVMIRVGDIDNLGFGWENDFTPFLGLSTDVHSFSWTPSPSEVEGLDRILIPASFVDTSFVSDTEWGERQGICGADGYSQTLGQDTRPKPIKMDLTALQNVEVNSANLVMFVDDFQAVVYCSQFKAWINGTRFIELERVLNHLDQSGPIGKIINVQFPPNLLYELQNPQMTLFIDDSTSGAADGFAIDFVKLLVNPKRNALAKGTAGGVILSQETNSPIAYATITIANIDTIKTDKEGKFRIDKIPVGLNPAEICAQGYAPTIFVFDIAKGQAIMDNLIYLETARFLSYQGQSMSEGNALILNNIQFEKASYNLLPEAKMELDKLAKFMQENENLYIELAGYTSSEGSLSANQILSEKRVRNCQFYLAEKGIEPKRVQAIGYGPENPIAPNDTPENRAKNRRVELKFLKM